MRGKLSRRVLSLAAAVGMALTSVPGQVTLAVEAKEDSQLHESTQGRERLSFNQGWKFIRQNIPEAIEPDYPLETLERWESVDLPHTVREENINASANRNYQGPAMYRKHFMLDPSYEGKKLYIEFEAVMQVSDVWVNGIHMTTTYGSETGDNTAYGGYLPFTIDITDVVKTDGTQNVITVLADNSDNGLVPPGKPQWDLDYTYFGGVYRNVWLDAVETVHLTDEVMDNAADAGIKVEYRNVTKAAADVEIQTNAINESDQDATIQIVNTLLDKDGAAVGTKQSDAVVKKGEKTTAKQTIHVENPNLWNVDTPYLYTLRTEVKQDGTVVDSFEQRIGIRTVAADVNRGLLINDEPVDVINGVNRHQEYAYVGFGASSALQRDDAIKYKTAGFNFVRCACHTASEDFLEACDELGILVLESVPGWQYWIEDKTFNDRVKLDIRRMIRRDRNHASVICYETSLNEAVNVPDGYTNELVDICHEETDSAVAFVENPRYGAKGEVIYGTMDEVKSYSDTALAFIREYGDYWQEQYGDFESSCRVERDENGFYPGGEARMVISGNNRLFDPYKFGATGNISLADAAKQYEDTNHRHIGVAMWIGIDHNRGYDEHTSDCGIWDLLRTPKYSYYAFESQRDVEERPDLEELGVETGPMIFAATSWSEKAPVVDKSHGETLGTDAEREIYVYSNAEKVRLSVMQGDKAVYTKENDPMDYKNTKYLDHPPFLFSKVPYTSGTWIKAEGLDASGKVIAMQEIVPAGEVKKVQLDPDLDNRVWTADGSDLIRVEATLTDKDGNMSTESMPAAFEIIGDAEIVGDGDKRIASNPAQARFGKTAVYLRAGKNPGKVKLRAWTQNGDVCELDLETVAPTLVQADFEEIAQGVPLEDGSMFVGDKEVVLTGTDVRKPEVTLLSIDGTDYEKSLISRNAAPFSYALHGNYAELSGKIALKNAIGAAEGTEIAPVVFKVYGDGSLLYASEEITDNVADLKVDVSGVEMLTLVAENVHEQINVEPAWLSLYLTEGHNDRDQSELKNNIASKAHVSASSTEEGTSVEDAIDGDLMTFWHSEHLVDEDHQETFTLTYDEPVSIRNALLQFQHDYQSITYRIETSNDGETWTTVARNEKTAHGNQVEDEFIATNVKMVRVVFEKVGSAQGSEGGGRNCAVLEEISLYEDKGVSRTEDFNLAGLRVAGNDLVYAYGKQNYTVKGYAGEPVRVKASVFSADCALTINGKTAASVTGNLEESAWISAEPDENGNVVLTVTSPDGKGSKTFTIHVDTTERTAWNAADDFVEGENGASGWSYGYLDGDNVFHKWERPMTYANNEYVWGDGNEWCFAGPRFMHPNENRRAARSFTVPADGTYRIDAILSKFTGAWGGVKAQIYHNTEMIFPGDDKYLGNLMDGKVWHAGGDVEAEAGDQIVIAIDAAGDKGGDGTFADMTISKLNDVHPEFDYASDLEMEWTWSNEGNVRMDAAFQGTQLRLRDENGMQTYHKGIGTHAYSDMGWNIAGKGYTRFEAVVGIDESQWYGDSYANATFEVYLNDKDSEPVLRIENITKDEDARKISVPISEDDTMLIIKVQPGDNNYNDHFDIADAKFFKAEEPQEPETFNLDVLRMIIASVAKANADDYLNADGSFDALAAALEAARNVEDKPQSQDEIDGSASTLNDAWLNVRYRPDEEKLKEIKERLDALK